MNLQAAEIKVLQSPRSTTDGGVNGSWIDLQGFVNPGGRNIKGVWLVGASATAGTASGLIQAASDTAGSDAATVCTFTNVTSAGGSEEKHFVTSKRYVRFVGDVQSTKTMLLTCLVVGESRVVP